MKLKHYFLIVISYAILIPVGGYFMNKGFIDHLANLPEDTIKLQKEFSQMKEDIRLLRLSIDSLSRRCDYFDRMELELFVNESFDFSRFEMFREGDNNDWRLFRNEDGLKVDWNAFDKKRSKN